MTGMQPTMSIAVLTQDIGSFSGGSVLIDVGTSHNPHTETLSSDMRSNWPCVARKIVREATCV